MKLWVIREKFIFENNQQSTRGRNEVELYGISSRGSDTFSSIDIAKTVSSYFLTWSQPWTLINFTHILKCMILFLEIKEKYINIIWSFMSCCLCYKNKFSAVGILQGTLCRLISRLWLMLSIEKSKISPISW